MQEISYSDVEVVWWLNISCREKGVLEEMLYLFHNILTKN